MIHVTVHTFEEAAMPMLRRHAHGSVLERRWQSYFGTIPIVCVKIWISLYSVIETMPSTVAPHHLLWALYFLTVYPSENVATGTCDCDEKTFRQWVKLFVPAISALEYQVIKWDNRFLGDIGNDALVTIDGTDMQVQMHYDKKYFSHKFRSKGLRYEIGVCIRTGFIVWINGPFRCGMNDISIARQCVIGCLTENEMLEADNGYEGEFWHFRTPNASYRSLDERQMKRRAAQRHETVNGRLKNFKVLSEKFRHPLESHSACCRAVAVIIQLSIENGQPLFQVDYRDERE